MNDISRQNKFAKTFNLPYHMGIYLAVNAVADSCVVIDGPNCIMPKIEFLFGNHDIYSTLLSQKGEHRVIYTMADPLLQRKNPEKKLLSLLKNAADSGYFSIVLATGLPFLKVFGIDYESLSANINGNVPVIDMPVKSLETDWLEGYSLALDAMVRALPLKKVKKRKNSVAIIGYFMDRNEYDHVANIEEIKRLLKICGLKLCCVFPSGKNYADLYRALEAELIISFPYGRKAAQRLAAKTGAKLIETGLPMGLRHTARWLKTVRQAAGFKGGLPEEIMILGKQAARSIAPFIRILAHRNIIYARDPYLFAAFSAYSSELCMRLATAFINSFHRPLAIARFPDELLFSPDTRKMTEIIKKIVEHKKANILVGNSFALSENPDIDTPFIEWGFPSYGHHCPNKEPFFGFAGAKTLAGRLLNSILGEYRVGM